MYDICIIGGGVIGLSIAQRLAMYELNICLLEKNQDVASGVSKANSGIVHGGFDDKIGTIKSLYSKKGHQKITELNKLLNFGYKNIGSLVLAFSEQEEETIRNLYKNGLENGVKNLSILSKEEVLEKEPNINNDVRIALSSMDSGVVSPYELTIALCDNALDNGLELKLNTKVIDIKKENCFKIETTSGLIESKLLINAAGLYADEISNMLGQKDYQITPTKGEYIVLDRDSGKLINSVLFQTPTSKGKGVLLAPTYHGNLLIGPNAKLSKKEDLGTDLESLKEIYLQAKKTLKHIPISRFITSFAGVRPNNSTDDFIIREKLDGFIECAGMKSPGLVSALPIAEDIVEKYISVHFNLNKKSNYIEKRERLIESQRDRKFLTVKEANQLSKLDLNDKNCIVCKCEQITREIIDHAILQSKIDLNSFDDMKKRLRVGTGYCQGSFCRSRVEKIIKEKYGELLPEYHHAKRVNRKEFLQYLKNENIEID